ncbi:MAG: hypothetical protein JO002_00930, partial [Burkholderiaceae bacterium]|nr:hypothetical protein [Burkholderiaceae bacterium]
MTRSIFKTLSGLFLFMNLAACTTPSAPNAAPAQSPAQVAAQICPPLQLALAGLQADIG